MLADVNGQGYRGDTMEAQVSIIGGGLAGSECALSLACRGIPVKLYEMRPDHQTPVHKTGLLAELVCSNSLKSMRQDSAAGLLKRELSLMGSELLGYALKARVPAGGALAVDRLIFSQLVSEAVEASPEIELEREEVTEVRGGPAVIAAGPLCSKALFDWLSQQLGSESLSFFDAAAPIVDADSLDQEDIFEQSRYAKDGSGDYLNCPMDRATYEAFISALVSAQRVEARDFEKRELFFACQPIEEVARTGLDSLRFGALKPVGLIDPKTGRRPWAVVQLRSENTSHTAYNLVGFQTNLTWSEQRRVFRMIPGLGSADFFRYGVMHRNSFVDSPHVLAPGFRIPHTDIRLAGQITGTEGYTEAIASGLLAALNVYAELTNATPVQLPRTTAFGSLVAYASDPSTSSYQPMHVNFGLFTPLEEKRLNKKQRYAAYAKRAQQDMECYVDSRPELFGRWRGSWPEGEDFA